MLDGSSQNPISMKRDLDKEEIVSGGCGDK
jgi:hypothetical protein